MKLAVPVLPFALIRNGLAMGQYYHSARRENRKPARVAWTPICSLPDFPEFAQAVRYGVPPELPAGQDEGTFTRLSTALDRNKEEDAESQRAAQKRNQEGDDFANLAEGVEEGRVIGGSVQLLATFPDYRNSAIPLETAFLLFGTTENPQEEDDLAPIGGSDHRECGRAWIPGRCHYHQILQAVWRQAIAETRLECSNSLLGPESLANRSIEGLT